MTRDDALERLSAIIPDECIEDDPDVAALCVLRDEVLRIAELDDLADALRASNEALRKIATYSRGGPLNPNGPICVGALSRDAEAMQRIARLALVGWGDAS